MTELTNKPVKCAKDHRCDWCGELIKKGEHAQYRAGVYDGDFYHGYMHPECNAAMQATPYEDFDGGEYMPMEQKRGKTIAESHD